MNILRFAFENNLKDIHGISMEAVMISVATAVCHFLIEAMSLKLEA